MNELFGIPMDELVSSSQSRSPLVAGALGLLAVRNRVLLKLGVRNVGRRRARSALIVVGLMLGTTIIAAALATGDTMSHTIRVDCDQRPRRDGRGRRRNRRRRRHLRRARPGDRAPRYFHQQTVDRVRELLAGSNLADGVAGGIRKDVAVQAPVQRQTEPSVSLFAPDATRMQGFAPITDVEGGEVTLADLRPGELYLNEKAADELHVRAGDPLLVYVEAKPVRMTIRAIVRFDGAGTADSALLLPLVEAQRLLGKPGMIKGILISNRGHGDEAVGLTDRVIETLKPTVEPMGLETAPAKRDALDLADELGNAFMALFTTFGTFSIAAGILLIFLIFVMLAAERRGELGIARAVGTRRGHLVQMFTFEGAAYDLIAAAVGALLGAAIAYGMVLAMASALGAEDEDAGLQVEYFVSARSLFIAFAIGGLLTLLVVAFSAWRVSVMTISTAIRNLPEPPLPRRRRKLVLALVSIALGVFLIAERRRRRFRNASHARRLPRLRRARADPPARRSSRTGRLHDLRARDRRRDAASVGLLGVRVRADVDGLLDVDRLRPDDGHRRRLGDGLQRRSHSRAR